MLALQEALNAQKRIGNAVLGPNLSLTSSLVWGGLPSQALAAYTPGWVGIKAGLEGQRRSHSYRVSNPRPSNSQRVAIMTTLSLPPFRNSTCIQYKPSTFSGDASLVLKIVLPSRWFSYNRNMFENTRYKIICIHFSPDGSILFVVNEQWTTNTWNIQHLKYNCCTTVSESTSVGSNSATNE
jgi:hypothetical protein